MPRGPMRIGVSSSLPTNGAMARRGTRNPTASRKFTASSRSSSLLETAPLGRAAWRNPQSVPDKDLQIVYEVSNVTCYISRISYTVAVNTPDDPETPKSGHLPLWGSCICAVLSPGRGIDVCFKDYRIDLNRAHSNVAQGAAVLSREETPSGSSYMGVAEFARG